MRFTPPKLYAITDVSISGLSHLEQVRQLSEGGAALIQLREKKASAGDWFDDALACAEYCREHNITLIVNDRVDIAMAINADGVHLGQDDMPVSAARDLMGPHAIIGLSTHNADQVRAALTMPVDYIGFGPIFPTRTKAKPDAVVGLERLREACEIAAGLPVVAIGGITFAVAGAVLASGAMSVAIVRDLLANPPQIKSRIRGLLSL